jgi:lactate dehydrogenase-like 2-hydroxyacid dehydrogenase
MKFKKMIVTGATKGDISSDYWKQINQLTGEVVFIGSEDLATLEKNCDIDCLISKFNPVDKHMIDMFPNLKYIGVYATGYGKIDTEYAKKKAITVTNVPGYSTESVAELVFGLILEELREISRAKSSSKSGNYSEEGFTATEIKGKTFGILGLGRIGTRVAELASTFGAKVLYWSRNKKKLRDKSIKYASMSRVVSQSDILSLHLALCDGTEGILDKKLINSIKKGALVVNTAPMELVDLSALEKRLAKRDITFVLDHSDEMEAGDLKRLKKYENCIIYPPIGYISKEASIAKQEIFVSNLKGFLKGKPDNIVN